MLLSTAFFIGLLGSVHCLGMCAPITWAVPAAEKEVGLVKSETLDNLGRIVTYSLFGLLVGLLGRGFSLAGWQQGLSIFAGTVMIAGVFFFGMEVPDKGMLKPIARMVLWIKSRIGPLIAKKGWKAQATLGLLNGLLPCGLVYAALIAAWSMGTVPGAMAYMALFGTGGTPPMMLAAAFFGKWMKQRFHLRIWKLAPKLVALVGVLLIIRGLNMGVPYLSPAILDESKITECVGNAVVPGDVFILED